MKPKYVMYQKASLKCGCYINRDGLSKRIIGGYWCLNHAYKVKDGMFDSFQANFLFIHKLTEEELEKGYEWV